MKFRSIGSVVWIVAILYFSTLMLLITLPYLSFRLNVDFLITKQRIIHLKHWRFAFYLHILTSVFILLAGAIQFVDHFLRNYRALHRRVGKMYVYLVLFISGPGALVMSFYANGDSYSRTSFVLLSLLWILFTALAFVFALRKDFVKHRTFIILSYALTLSAITLRLYALVLPHFIHLDAKSEYALIAWLSWTINLAVAGLVIYATRSKNITS